MADRGKVVCGLECHMRVTGPECGKCPYDAIDLRCIKSLRDDAIALLKAQEPRVMNLNEIHRGMAVWLEQYKVPEMLLVIGGSSAGGAKCFITEDDRSIAALDEDYGIFWRVWSREPTEEQRKAAKWGWDSHLR